MATTEADDLAAKQEKYVLQLREVEAALEVDPSHVELLKIKGDLNELIDLTRTILKEKIVQGVPFTKKSIVSPNATTTATTSGYGNSNAASGSSAAVEDCQEKILSRIKTFKDDDYRDFLFKVFDESRPPETLRTIIKRYTNRGKKSIKRQLTENRGKEDNDSDLGEASQCNGSNGRKSSHSAWKAPLIYRGDMFPPQDGLLFITVRNICLKANIYSDHRSVAGVVCIVNSQRNLVFWSLINWKKDEICETFSEHYGVTIDSLAVGLPLDQVPSPFSQEAKDSDLCNSVIETCMAEIKPELDALKIDLQDEDMRYCAMLHYWRKMLAEMRKPGILNRVLPTKTMANLSKLRDITEVEVEAMMKDDDCFNEYNYDQAKTIWYILNEGESNFEKILKSFCNRCAERGHIARICTKPKNRKAVDEYYKKNHPDMIARQQKRRKMNSLRNKRLKRDEAAANYL